MKNDIQIIDNFLEDEQCYQICKTCLSNTFPWYTSKVIYGNQFELLCDDIDNYQYTHFLYKTYEPQSSYHIEILRPFVEKLNMGAIFRAKLNMKFRTDNIIKHSYHVDTSYNCKSMIYYINHNNGYTEFENGQRVESVMNRLLIFPSNLMHTGTTCSDNFVRLVLNINYFD